MLTGLIPRHVTGNTAQNEYPGSGSARGLVRTSRSIVSRWLRNGGFSGSFSLFFIYSHAPVVRCLRGRPGSDSEVVWRLTRIDPVFLFRKTVVIRGDARFGGVCDA